MNNYGCLVKVAFHGGELVIAWFATVEEAKAEVKKLNEEYQSDGYYTEFFDMDRMR